MENNINPAGYRTKGEIFRTILVWFLPAVFIVSILMGLGSTGLCILFCSPSGIETLFFKIGVGSLLVGGIYIPIVSAKKIVKTGTFTSKVLQTLGLTILGYFLVIIIGLGWVFVSAPINEKIIDTIENTIAKSQENDRQQQIIVANVSSGIQFDPGEAYLAKIDDKFTVVSLAGIVRNLESLSKIESYDNLILVSKVQLNDQEIILPKVDPHTSFGGRFSLGMDSPISLTSQSTQNVDLEVVLPTEEVSKLAPAGEYNFKVILEIWSQSPFTWEQSTLWTKEVEFAVKKQEVYFQDQGRMLSAYLPKGYKVSLPQDSEGKYKPLEDGLTNYLIIAPNGAVLRSRRTTEFIKIDSYIKANAWGKNVSDIKSLTGAELSSSNLLYVLVVTNKNTTPYKQIIQGYNYEDQPLEIIELSKPDQELEKVLDKYILKYSSWR